ncbi:uncharacterized protein LOC110262505 isoform X2 [Arachis ipaensis]|uniref:uncharacterized protein LOC110262505 isoform X2 n=1 Tax=Arachis ipaensis TaxID=130454 RepID=UPI000A2B4195|nr:uncharacterized protein LOC110262505 isoform X2 [Arachis ipaensis]
MEMKPLSSKLRSQIEGCYDRCCCCCRRNLGFGDYYSQRLQTDELDGAGDGTCHHSERIGFPFSLSRSVCEGEEEGSNENSHIEGCNHSSLSTTPSFFYVDRSEVSFSVGSCLLPHPDKSFLLLRQIPFIQSYAGDVNRVIHIFGQCFRWFMHLILQRLTGIFVLIYGFVERKQFSADISSKLGSSFSIVPFVIVVSVCTILTMIATLHVAQLFFFHILLVEKS